MLGFKIAFITALVIMLTSAFGRFFLEEDNNKHMFYLGIVAVVEIAVFFGAWAYTVYELCG